MFRNSFWFYAQDYSWQCFGDYMIYKELNVGQLHARQAFYSLYNLTASYLKYNSHKLASEIFLFTSEPVETTKHKEPKWLIHDLSRNKEKDWDYNSNLGSDPNVSIWIIMQTSTGSSIEKVPSIQNLPNVVKNIFFFYLANTETSLKKLGVLIAWLPPHD